MIHYMNQIFEVGKYEKAIGLRYQKAEMGMTI